MDNQLILSVSPHLRSGVTTRSLMLDVLIALCPALIASVLIFGFRALLLTLISAGACLLLEWGYEKLLKMPVTVSDLSALVTGVLLAYNVPVNMPVWELLIGDAAAIVLAKMLFGGLGCNFMNPALVGRVVLMFSFTTDMTAYTYPDALFGVQTLTGSADVLSGATPLVADGLSWDQFGRLLLGLHGGVIGETCALALILGGIYLVIRRVIKPIIPLCYIGSVIVFSFLFGGSTPILSVFMGGVMLGGIFMATDYVTSPITDWGKVIFGVFCGLVTSLIRVFGNYAEGVTFGIILGNLIVPYLNDLTMKKPLGAAAGKEKK